MKWLVKMFRVHHACFAKVHLLFHMKHLLTQSVQKLGTCIDSCTCMHYLTSLTTTLSIPGIQSKQHFYQLTYHFYNNQLFMASWFLICHVDFIQCCAQSSYCYPLIPICEWGQSWTFHFGGKGGATLSLQEKLHACVTFKLYKNGIDGWIFNCNKNQ